MKGKQRVVERHGILRATGRNFWQRGNNESDDTFVGIVNKY